MLAKKKAGTSCGLSTAGAVTWQRCTGQVQERSAQRASPCSLPGAGVRGAQRTLKHPRRSLERQLLIYGVELEPEWTTEEA